MTAKELVHAFAGNPLDRGTSIRHSGDKIDAMKELPSARYLVFQDLKVLTSDGAIDYVAHSSLPKLKVIKYSWAPSTMSLILLFKLKTRISANLLIARQWCVKKICRSQIVAQARSMLAWHREKPVLFSMRQRNSSGEGWPIEKMSRLQCYNTSAH